MERSLFKRALPYFEGVCFAAAWIVGVAVAVQRPSEPAPAPRERNLVVSDPVPSAADISRPQRVFRPIPDEEIQEGG